LVLTLPISSRYELIVEGLIPYSVVLSVEVGFVEIEEIITITEIKAYNIKTFDLSRIRRIRDNNLRLDPISWSLRKGNRISIPFFQKGRIREIHTILKLLTFLELEEFLTITYG
jgi:hypothetical protein